MIIMMDPHSLDPALAHHLMSTDRNEHVEIRTHGLLAETTNEAFRELKLLATGSRTARPGCHAILSPSREYTEKAWQSAWEIFEREFGFEDQPYVEATHNKFGRGGRTAAHRHRVYLRVSADGRCIHLPHIAPRAELVARQCELENGEVLTRGRWNRAVISRLEKSGKFHEVAILKNAGFWDSQRPEATSRAERAVTERNEDISADEAKRAAYVAWVQSENGSSFVHRLRASGLHACIGDSGRPIIVTRRGSIYRLAAAVTSGAKACGANTIKAKAVSDRLFGVGLPAFEQVRNNLEIMLPENGWRSVTGIERSSPSSASEKIARRTQISEAIPYPNSGVMGREHAIAPNRVVEKHEKASSLETVQARQFFEKAFGLSSQGKFPFLARITPESAESLDNWSSFDEELLAPYTHTQGNILTLKGVSKASAIKAALANVEAEHGDAIRWVEKKAKTTVIEMKEEAQKIIINSGRVSARAPSQTSLAVMVSYVAKCGKSGITITGGDAATREIATRLLTRRGIQVTNPEMHLVIEDELTVIRLRQLAVQWKAARKRLAEGAASTSDYAMALAEIEPCLDEIEKRWPAAAATLREEISILSQTAIGADYPQNISSGHVRPQFS